MKSFHLFSGIFSLLFVSTGLLADVTVQESKARFYIGRASTEGTDSSSPSKAALSSASLSALQACKSECSTCVELSKESSSKRGEMLDAGDAGEVQGLGSHGSRPTYRYTGSAKVVVIGLE